MTNEELLDDLKQFIAATVSQKTAGLATKDDLRKLEQRLDDKLDQVQTVVADALTSINDTHDATHRDYDERLRLHEQWIIKAAPRVGTPYREAA